MRWSTRLYKGEEAAKWTASFKVAVKHLLSMPDGYLIILANYHHNLLEIIPVRELSGPFADLREYSIVGIAVGKDEAIQLTLTIISDVYAAQKDVDVFRYFTEFEDEHPRNTSKRINIFERSSKILNGLLARRKKPQASSPKPDQEGRAPDT